MVWVLSPIKVNDSSIFRDTSEKIFAIVLLRITHPKQFLMVEWALKLKAFTSYW